MNNAGNINFLRISDSNYFNGWPTVSFYQKQIEIFWVGVRKNNWYIFSWEYNTKVREIFRLSQGYLCNVRVLNLSEGKTAIVFPCYYNKKQTILCLIKYERNVIKIIDISKDLSFASRPFLYYDEKYLYIIYDNYGNKGYDLWLTRVSIFDYSMKSIRITDNNYWNYFGKIIINKNDIYIAYLQKRDIINKQKVIDQSHNIKLIVSKNKNNIFSKNITLFENLDTINLNQGLVPIYKYTGYVGNRINFDLVFKNKSLYIFYEMKFDELSSAIEDKGGLIFKSYKNYTPSLPKLLHENLRYYKIKDGIDKNKIAFCAIIPPEKLGYGNLIVGLFDILDGKIFTPLDEHRWQMWNNIDLGRVMSRYNKRYKLKDKNLSVYWGDIHCHGKMSGDAEGDIDEIYFYAKDKGKLDFWANTDNDSMFLQERLSHIEWEYQKDFSDKFNKIFRVTSFPGYEYLYPCLTKTGRGNYNHRIILFNSNKGPLLRHRDPEGRTIEKFTKFITRHRGFIYAHHPKWNFPKFQKRVYVEVCSSWIISFDIKDASLYTFLMPDNDRSIVFIGSSDTHRRIPGLGGALTAVYSKNNTRKEILKSIQKGYCYVTNGLRCFLDFRVNNFIMGSYIKATKPEIITITVKSPRPIKRVIIYKNKDIIKVFEPIENNYFNIKWIYNNSDSYRHCLWCEIMTVDFIANLPGNIMPAFGNRAWSNPIWCNY